MYVVKRLSFVFLKCQGQKYVNIIIEVKMLQCFANQSVHVYTKQ